MSKKRLAQECPGRDAFLTLGGYFREEKSITNINFWYEFPADPPDPYVWMTRGQKVSSHQRSRRKTHLFGGRRPRFSARTSMTRRVLEKLCPEKGCVDFSAPNTGNDLTGFCRAKFRAKFAFLGVAVRGEVNLGRSYCRSFRVCFAGTFRAIKTFSKTSAQSSTALRSKAGKNSGKNFFTRFCRRTPAKQ